MNTKRIGRNSSTNNISKKTFLPILVAIFLISGCATRSMYQEANNSFSKGFESASDAITTLLGNATRDLRLLAIGRYLENGDTDDNIHSGKNETNVDIARTKVTDSFARYVCAGFGLFVLEYGGLRTLDTYRLHIAELSKAPSDDLGELLESLRNLEKSQPSLLLPENQSALDLQIACRDEVKQQIPPGAPLGEASPEIMSFLLDAKEQIDTLVSGLKKAAVSLLKITDEAKRTKALKEYVQNNNPVIDAVLNGKKDDTGATKYVGLANSDSLTTAWSTTRNAALVVPYYQFKSMMKLDRENEIPEILKQENIINNALSAYDKLSLAPDPKELVKDMQAAQIELVRLANGELKPGEAWAAFVNFADSTNAARDAIKSATESISNAQL